MKEILTSFEGRETRFVDSDATDYTVCEHGISLSQPCDACIDEQRKIEEREEYRRGA